MVTNFIGVPFQLIHSKEPTHKNDLFTSWTSLYRSSCKWWHLILSHVMLYWV